MSTVSMLMVGVLLAIGALPSDVNPINSRTFNIPITIDSSRRAGIKQLILYSSPDQGKSWQEDEVATPDKDAFKFFAPTDGLYWFSVVVVDQQGNREPPDVNNLPPSTKILVDTLNPVVRLTALRQGGDVVATWEIQEDHPDLSSLRLEYRTPESTWYPVPIALPVSIGSSRFRSPGTGPVSVRMQVQDLAKNVGMASAELNPEPQLASVPANPVIDGMRGNSQASSGMPGFSNATPPSITQAPLVAAGPGPSSVGRDNVIPADSGNQTSVIATSASSPSERLSGRLLGQSEPSVVNPSLTGATDSKSGQRQLPPLHYLNSRQVPIEYTVNDVGPSGIGSVELWITQDDGLTWKNVQDLHNQKSPLVADLPGEGVYGFRVVVKSRAGLGRRPPMAGDVPELRVEVDESAPLAQLYAPEPDPHSRDALTISWRVTDRNIDAKPILIQWAEQREGPWQSIGEGPLPNNGRYSWKLPPNLPIRVFLKLTAKDMAGNVSEAISQEPVLVDLHEPVATVTGLGQIPSKP